MKPNEELFSINIKGEQRGEITVHDLFLTVGKDVMSITGEMTTVKEIILGKGLLNIYFEDGTRMIRGYDPQKIDLFYRTIKEEDGRTTND